jgi:phosphoesterase RecJ-like protein
MIKHIKNFASTIKQAKNILIISHIGPDGDTLGSMLALKQIILSQHSDKNIETLVIGKVPEIYSFLPGIKETKTPHNIYLLKSYDVAITVDCASIDRLGDALELYKNSKYRINIDHHVTNDGFGDINIINANAASAGEIIYEIAEYFDVKIDFDMAQNLYTSILTDTGGFRFENTSPKTFKIAAALLKAGVRPDDIYKKCFESKPIQMVRLAAYVINNAVFCEDNKIAYSLVSRETMKNFDATDEHIDGISEALRQISTIEAALIFKETAKGYTKVSFRSNGIDVCKIAEFFGGGGHKLAAGCTIEKNLNDAKNEVLPILKKQIKNAENSKNIQIYN